MRSDEQTLAYMERAVEGLLFMSESDHPFEVIWWDGAGEVTHDTLRRLAGVVMDAPVVEQSVDDFFRVAAGEQGWKGEKEIADARRYQALVRLLKESLTGVKAYRVGRRDVRVYVVGRCRSGGVAGVSTKVVET